MFDLAQLSNADGRQRDARPGREAEEQGEGDDEGEEGWLFGSCSSCGCGRKPEAERGDQTERDGEQHGVEAADAVGDEARQVAAKARADVEDGEHLVAEGGGDAVRQAVRADVGERDEEAPLDEEDAERRQGEDARAEDAEVGQDRGERERFGREAGADEEVGDDQQDQVDECDHACRPGETDAWQECLQQERQQDATK